METEIPGVGKLKLDEYAWTMQDTLPSWQGSQERQGPYASKSSPEVSTGKVEIAFVAPDGANQPTDEQIAAYHYLKANDAHVTEEVLKALYHFYPTLQENYCYDPEVQAEIMPDVERPEDLKHLIGVGSVLISILAKEDVAYVGLEFGCDWDEEHGLGMMTHKDRIISIGNADTSFDDWIAEADIKASRGEE